MTDILASRAARVTLVMACLYGGFGVSLPFLSRWLEVERGLGGAEIGAVLSIAQLTRILIGPVIAFWADGAADRRRPIIVLGFAAVAAYAAFFFLAHSFWPLLLCGFLALATTQAVTPFVEAALLRATAEGKLSYGVGRGLGSLSFIIATIAGGALIARFGLGAVVVWVLSAVVLFALSAWLGLKPDPSPASAQTQSVAARLTLARGLLRTRRFLILIVACGLIQAAHAFYYGFSVMVWRGQAIPAETVGVLWSVGVAVEVVFLWTLPFFERRIDPVGLILIGAAGATVRWLALGFAPTGLVLWPLQALHALSFAAAHVGAMRLLYREAPEAAAGMAQTLYAALASGLLMGASTLLSGVLYDAVGAQGYWAMAILAAAGGTLGLLLLEPPLRRPIGAKVVTDPLKGEQTN